jgi:hypothetical protein
VNQLPVRIYRWSPSLLLLILAVVALFFPGIEGDTEALVRGASKFQACVWSLANSGVGVPCEGSEHFAIFQYIPSWILGSFGFSERGILRGLVGLSFLAFLGTFWIFFRALRRQWDEKSSSVFYLGALLLLTSPLLWYSRSSFGEMLAAFLIALFVEACIAGRSPARILLTLVAAAWTKEPALPILVFLGGSCLILSRTGVQKARGGQFLALGLGSVISALVTLGFNWLRFGAIYNVPLFDPLFRVHDLSTRLSFFLGIWLSPNGGMLFFWPSFFIPFLFLIRRRRTGEANSFRWGPLLLVMATLAGLTLGFSGWFAPLGWVAWGPRLLLPWIPACLLIVLYYYTAEIERTVVRLVSDAKRSKFFLAAFAWVSIPSFMILHRKQVLWRIFESTPECPTPAVIQENAAYYYQCMNSILWPKSLALLEFYRVLVRPELLIMTGIYCLALMRIWSRIRSEGSDQPNSSIYELIIG